MSSSVAVLCLALSGAHAFAPTAMRSSAPAVRSRASVPLALDVTTALDAAQHFDASHALDTMTNQLSASFFGLDTNPYGGKGAFDDADSASDLPLVLILAVVFPTVATWFLYKDGNE